MVHAQQPHSTDGAAIITFESSKLDLGKISKTEILFLEFAYCNTGSEPLLISKVDTSCGCIKPAWSKQPLLPNKKGMITVTFDPHTKHGYTLLSLYVKSNAGNGLQIVRIQAEIF